MTQPHIDNSLERYLVQESMKYHAAKERAAKRGDWRAYDLIRKALQRNAQSRSGGVK